MPRPLIDLHRHLEGALRPSQLVEAALRTGASLATPREVLSRVVPAEAKADGTLALRNPDR